MEISSGMVKGLAATGSASACCVGSYHAYNSLTFSNTEIKDESKPKASPEEGKNDISRTSQIPEGANRSHSNMRSHAAQTHFPRSNSDCQGLKADSKITKFDRALLDYLEKKEMNFKVSGKVEISESKDRFEINVSVDTKELAEDAEKTKLKSVNGNEDWIWGAKISFSVYGGNHDSLPLDEEDKKSIDEFFEKLKSTGNKEFKSKFIDEIANSRSIKVCEGINGFSKLTKGTDDLEAYVKENNKLISPRGFFLDKDENSKMKLYLSEDNEFKDWIKFSKRK